MSTFAVAATVSALLLGLGTAAITRHRGAIGLLVSIQLFAGALITLAATLYSLTGRNGALGQVVIAAIITGAVAAAVILIAVHLASVRGVKGGER